MWGLLVHSHNVLTRYAQCFLPQSKSKLIFYTSISYQSKCKKCVMRYGSGMQTRTLIFAELLKEREILHFFLLVPEITSAFPTHLSPILPFSFSSQHYPRVNIHLKRILVLVPFEFFSTLLRHIPALITFFTRQCYCKRKSSLPSQRLSGFPGTTAAEKRDQMMIPFRVAATSCKQQRFIWDGFFSLEVPHNELSAEVLVPRPNLFRFSTVSDMSCPKTFWGIIFCLW